MLAADAADETANCDVDSNWWCKHDDCLLATDPWPDHASLVAHAIAEHNQAPALADHPNRTTRPKPGKATGTKAHKLGCSETVGANDGGGDSGALDGTGPGTTPASFVPHPPAMPNAVSVPNASMMLRASELEICASRAYLSFLRDTAFPRGRPKTGADSTNARSTPFFLICG